MRQGAAVLVVFLLLALAPLSLVNAKDDGIYNRSNGCGCHGGSGSVTAQLTGLPTAYTPSTTYSLTVAMSTSPNTGGFNLEVNRGALSNPGPNAQVSSNGFQATHGFSPGTTSWTVQWTAPASGSGVALFDLAVLSANGNGATSGDIYDTLSISVGEDINANSPPTASDLTISPGTPLTGDDLTLTYTYTDEDGDAESGTVVAWHLNGVAVPGQTSLTLPASATTKGDAWHAVVTPSDGEDAGASVASSSVVVANTAPEVVTIDVSSESPDTNDDVSFTFQTADADGDTITASETRWLLDGAVVSSLNNASTLPAVASRAGDIWTVEVRVSDGEDMSAWFASADVLVGSSNQPPVVSDVMVGPEGATSLDELTATWTASDADGDALVQTELMWMKDGVHQAELVDVNPLPSSYTAKGEAWTAVVRVSDGEAWSPTTSSEPRVVANAAPTVLNAHLISPSFSSLHPLTVNVTTDDVDGDDVDVAAVRWHLNGVEQSDGVDSLVLNATHLQRGDAWHAVITVDDGIDQSTFTTDAVVVLNAAPQIDIEWPADANSLVDLAPTIQVLDLDGDATSMTTTWYKNGFRDAGLANTSSVEVAKLAPNQDWRLVVEVSDGELTTVSEASIVLVNLEPVADISVASSHVWYNETTVLSAEASTDSDGTLVEYAWSWNGGVARGATVALVLTEDTEVRLVVSDDSGASDETTLLLEVEAGPTVQNLRLVNDGAGNIDLAWAWPGDEVTFNILRNGEPIATTTSPAYRDQPPMSGVNTYAVQPVNDERVFLNGMDTISTSVEPVVVEAPGPATGLGLGLGGLMLLALVVAPLLGKREGGAFE